MLWAALAALSIPGFYYLFGQVGLRSWVPLPSQIEHLQIIYMLQVLTFLLLVMLFRWRPLLMCLIPAKVKRLRAHRHAQAQFLQQGVHNSGSRGGVLLFVSVAEHYVEIIADRAVAAKVTDSQWESTIAGFTSKLRQGQVAAGFSLAIQDCGALLCEHFPANNKNSDELPNHLIEV